MIYIFTATAQGFDISIGGVSTSYNFTDLQGMSHLSDAVAIFLPSSVLRVAASTDTVTVNGNAFTGTGAELYDLLNTTVFLNKGASTAKRYYCLLSQSGATAPEITSTDPNSANKALVNTLGGVPVFSRQAAGTYRISLNGAFPSTKTLVTLTAGSSGGTNLVFSYEAVGNYIDFTVGYVPGTGDTVVLDDSLLVNATMKIEVYP